MKRKLSRRDFIKIAGTAGALAALVQLTPIKSLTFLQSTPTTQSPPLSQKQDFKWGMIIDQGKCTGCNFCTYTCKAVNNVPPDIYWNYVFTEKIGTSPNTKTLFMPRPCMHCEKAPCVDVCPVKATYKRKDGIVMMNYDRCIGCRYCMVACPYGARSFNWREYKEPFEYSPTWGYPEVPRRSKGVVEKCTFCVHRIDAGLERGLMPGVDRSATPACVNICPVEARHFGDLINPDSEVSKLLTQNKAFRLREELGVEPRVYYLPP